MKKKLFQTMTKGQAIVNYVSVEARLKLNHYPAEVVRNSDLLFKSGLRGLLKVVHGLTDYEVDRLHDDFGKELPSRDSAEDLIRDMKRLLEDPDAETEHADLMLSRINNYLARKS